MKYIWAIFLLPLLAMIRHGSGLGLGLGLGLGGETTGGFIQLESGDYLLLESGDKILKEHKYG